MKIPPLPPSLVAAFAMSLLLFPAARGEAETSTIKFSDPAKPGTLRIAVSNSDLRIQGSDLPEVSVRSELQQERGTTRPDGLRVLTSSSNYALTEKDNVVSLTYGTEGFPGPGGHFEIQVPRNTNVVVANSFGGEIAVNGVAGDIEVKSLNGEVKLGDIAGAALVETMNGEIQVGVRSLAEGKPLSFTSMNGAVEIRLPAESKANVRLRSHNGAILTDFDEKQLVTKTAALKANQGFLSSKDAAEIRDTVREAVRTGMEAAREATRAARDAIREATNETGRPGPYVAEEEVGHLPLPPIPPLPPMTGGKIVTGTLNGGGPEIRVTTMNGDVTLRKSQ
ncbi:MAG TPA: DUF4097 family beta strand repeat-containing protein [Opitutus sp.]|nr:DUF4097 family beta strand repeat-containing protein [Opitutus sp.]